MAYGHRIQLRLVDYIGKVNLTYLNHYVLLIFKAVRLFLLSTYQLLVKYRLGSWEAIKLGGLKNFEQSDLQAFWPPSLFAFQPPGFLASQPSKL